MLLYTNDNYSNNNVFIRKKTYNVLQEILSMFISQQNGHIEREYLKW